MDFSVVKYKKLLITGLGRSGTSAIASIVKNLGYYFGENVSCSTGEDVTLRKLLSMGDIDSVSSELYRRCQNYELVAYKDPKLFSVNGEKLLREISNDWLYIIIIRDILSVARRNVKSMSIDLDESLSNAAHHQMKLVNFYNKAKISNPVLLVSYEQINAMEFFLIDFTRFLGFDLNEAQLHNLIELINADKNEYLAIANKTT